VLVLTRRAGESVMVGDDVVITVLEVRGDVIRLGVAAPRSIQVHREEVYRELQRANREAASPSDTAVLAVTTLLGRTDAGRPGAGSPARIEPGAVKPASVRPGPARPDRG
jgi:carbon storage regulator